MSDIRRSMTEERLPLAHLLEYTENMKASRESDIKTADEMKAFLEVNSQISLNWPRFQSKYFQNGAKAPNMPQKQAVPIVDEAQVYNAIQ